MICKLSQKYQINRDKYMKFFKYRKLRRLGNSLLMSDDIVNSSIQHRIDLDNLVSTLHSVVALLIKSG